MKTNPNPDEKLLDETEKKIVAAVVAGIELSHVQNVAPEESAKLISNKIREIILSNFASKGGGVKMAKKKNKLVRFYNVSRDAYGEPFAICKKGWEIMMPRWSSKGLLIDEMGITDWECDHRSHKELSP